jgi:hypothetical protein
VLFVSPRSTRLNRGNRRGESQSPHTNGPSGLRGQFDLYPGFESPWFDCRDYLLPRRQPGLVGQDPYYNTLVPDDTLTRDRLLKSGVGSVGEDLGAEGPSAEAGCLEEHLEIGKFPYVERSIRSREIGNGKGVHMNWM